jgi:hypothetical protein
MDVLQTCLPQHLGLRRGGLRLTVTTSIVIVATGLVIGSMIITIIVFRHHNSISSHEFGAGRLLISSGASFSSSESSSMMTLLSPGGPRMSQLRSSKSFLVNSASREVSAMKFSSSEGKERSITGVFSEELPCSKTGEQGWREEVSDGDPGGGGDPDGTSGGVVASLDEGFPSGEGEHSRLMPLWSSIDGEHRAREGKP